MFEHVSPGQDFGVSAFEFNAMKDAARMLQGVAGFEQSTKPSNNRPQVIRAINDGNTALDRYSVMMVAGVAQQQTTVDQNDSVEQVLFKLFHPGQGVYDPEKHILAVVQQPIGINGIGYAIVNGLTLAKIATGNGNWATPDPVGTTALFTPSTTPQPTRIVQPRSANGIGIVYLTNVPRPPQAVTNLRQTGPNQELLQYTRDGNTWITFANLSGFLPPPP